jgi:hypothetical protein
VYARLGGRADTRYRQTDVDSRADTTEEELGFQEDLTIGDTIGKSQEIYWRAYVISTCLMTFVGLQGSLENLAKMQNSDGSSHIRRHITTLGLDDWESSQGTSAKVVVHLRCTLEQARVEVEDVTRVRLTTRRTTEE